MAFTPLVSPAVTPQESHFQTLPEFTIPGAYFSPLTSPALQAQNGQQHQLPQHQHPHPMPGYYTNPSTAGSSLATSPVDLNMDIDMMGDGLSLPEPARKTRKKTQVPRSAGPSSRVRQSPIVKAQKRKSTTLSSVIPPQELNTVLREVQSQPGSAGLLKNHHFADSSGTESISPEALSEAVMGPPPRPASSMHSPALQGQSHSAPCSASMTASSLGPATPASLMSLERAQQLNGGRPLTAGSHSAHPLAQSHEVAMLDDFELPPAVAVPHRPILDRIETNPPTTSAEATPRMAAFRKTPKLGPSSCQSITSSPALSAIASPSSAMTPGTFAARKADNSKSGKNVSKKRGSIGASSVLISPAIRPKISPSIKPLLPEGGESLNFACTRSPLLTSSSISQRISASTFAGIEIELYTFA